MPNYQGKFDGLCGMYAITNAFAFCGVDSSDHIWRAACSALPRKMWPSVLWDGTDYSQMRKMIRKIKRDVKLPEKLEIKYPFDNIVPASNGDFWKFFHEIFDEPKLNKCAIVGVKHPFQHWTVIFRNTRRRIHVYDSDPHESFFSRNLKSLYAGSNRRDPGTWVIDRRELIVFEAP